LKIINATRADTGGQTEKLSHVINTMPDAKHSSRACVIEKNYMNFSADILYNQKWKTEGYPEWFLDLWKKADVYHFHHRMDVMRLWPLKYNNPKAGVLMHIHGRPNKDRTPKLLAESDQKNKIIRVVSTPSLLPIVFYQKHRWFPIPLDFQLIKQLRKDNKKDDGLFRVAHAPTVDKDTDLFLEVMKQIQQKYDFVRTVLVQKQAYTKCLHMKASADLYFNSIQHGPGSNTFEAMIMEQPVIAGCVSQNHRHVKGSITKRIFKELNDGELPFITATEDTLFEVIEELILNVKLREELIRQGKNYVYKYHTYKYTAELAIRTYKQAIELRK